MKLALSVAWYLIQFLRLMWSIGIAFLGVTLIFTPSFWQSATPNPWNEKLMWLGIFVFSILALHTCNRLVDAIQTIKQGETFTPQNQRAFEWAIATTAAYLVGKYALLLYVISVEKGSLALADWWADSSTRLSEVISLGLLTCFFWIIAQLISEGIGYKTENELTI